MTPLPHPPLAVIADRFTDEERADRAAAAVRAGARWVHLRDHAAHPEAFDTAARLLAQRLRDAAENVVVSVNTRLTTADSLDAGLHVGARGPSTAEARAALGEEALIGYSAHEEGEATGDRAQEIDYYFYSPVFATSSKPGAAPTGLSALQSFCQVAAPTPVLALGGITPERVSACQRAGAAGVAVLSGIMEADAPFVATQAYLRALAPASTQ